MDEQQKILIVDDHQLILDGIREMIEKMDNFEVLATASDGKDALQKSRALSPDIILTDLDMPRMNGLELIKEVKKQQEEIRIIVLTMYNEKGLLKKAVKYGASGYLLKNSDKETFFEALLDVSNGDTYYPDSVTSEPGKTRANIELKKNPSFSQIDQLTEREKEIVKLIAKGFSNKEIGDQLFISHRTVDTHRTNLMKKLDVSNIAGLIRFAIENGLAD